MPNRRDENLTRLFDAAASGDESSRQRLWAVVYDELREIARRQLGREGSRHTLQTTALVQEAYLRLAGRREGPWSNRRHFFAAAANAMRRICVDDARKRGRLKRGGARVPLQTGLELPSFDQDPVEVIAVDDALEKLEHIAPRQAEVVKLRYFVGLTIGETADVLGISPRTVDVQWRYARAWLHRALHDADTNASS